jgi:YggT family protein
MQNALIFIFRTLVDLYIMAYVLRIIMQWLRVDIRNPLTQSLLRITNPLVLPVRRFIPSIFGLDTTSLLITVVLESLATWALISLACTGDIPMIRLLGISLLRLAHLVLNIYFFLILGYVIISWVAANTYNPAIQLLSSIVRPVLAPLQKLIPPIGGMDLSPLFAAIGIQAIMIMLPVHNLMFGLGCTSLALLR